MGCERIKRSVGMGPKRKSGGKLDLRDKSRGGRRGVEWVVWRRGWEKRVKVVVGGRLRERRGR